MMTLRTTSSLLVLCASVALASSGPRSYASSDSTAIYTTEQSEKSQPKEAKAAKPTGASSFVAAGSVQQAPQQAAPAPLFSVSLEPKCRATVSQSFTGPEIVTYFATWKQTGGSVVLTFSADDGKRPITFSRSGGRLTATGWNASDWGGKPAPEMHKDASDPQTAVGSSGHHFSFHL